MHSLKVLRVMNCDDHLYETVKKLPYVFINLHVHDVFCVSTLTLSCDITVICSSMVAAVHNLGILRRHLNTPPKTFLQVNFLSNSP